MNILVSACLLGVCCRYDGTGPANEAVLALMKDHTLIPVCPEQLGGLPTPRAPSECRGNRVVTASGEDVTEAFHKGAQEVLKLARLYGCRLAVLKERSPSCGSGKIYDGTFSRKLVAGTGVTAALLMRNSIKVISENDLSELSFGGNC